MKRSHYAQAFESMSPSEEQKNRIYNNIIEKAEKKERSKKQAPKAFFRTVPTIASAAAITAFMSAFIVIAIQSDTISGGIDKLFENVGHYHPDAKTQIGGSSKKAAGDLSIYDIYYSDDEMAVIYEFITSDEVLKNCNTLNADITSKINSSIINTDEQSVRFVKTDDKFLSEMVYNIESISDTENIFTLQSEIKNIYGEGIPTDSTFTTGKYKGKCTASAQTFKNANDICNEYYPNININGSTGIIEKITVTPFETIIDTSEECSISLYDQNGCLIKNIKDGIFEPIPMKTEQLNMIVSGISEYSKPVLVSFTDESLEGFRVPYSSENDTGIYIDLFKNTAKYGQLNSTTILSGENEHYLMTYVPYAEAPEIHSEGQTIPAGNFINSDDLNITVQNSFIKKYDSSFSGKLYVNCIIKNSSGKRCSTSLKNFFVTDADVSAYYINDQKHYAECGSSSFIYDEETLIFDKDEEKTVRMEYKILSSDIGDKFYLVTEFRNEDESIDIIRLEPTVFEN